MNKILFISPQPYFAWRGSPIRVRFNLESLAELGYDIDLLTLPLGQDAPIEGVAVHRVSNPMNLKQLAIGPSLNKALFDLLLLERGLRLVRAKDYHLIHGVEEAGLIGLLLAKHSGARLIYEKHSDPASYRRGVLRNMVLGTYAGVERLVARQADAVIATGEGLAQQLRAGGIQTPVHAIPDMASSRSMPCPERAERLRQGIMRAGAKGALVSFVGSFAIYQGVDLLLQAIPLALRQQPALRFQIIGGSPGEIDERRRRLQAQGVAPQACCFRGMLPPEELPSYLAASDILVSPRLSGQNSPLKLLDYMRAGRAILATDVPSNRLILDASRARLVEPTPAALAAGMLELESDAKLRQRLGEAVRRHYKAEYGFKRFKQRLAQCYERLLLACLPGVLLRLWRRGEALCEQSMDVAIETSEFWMAALG